MLRRLRPASVDELCDLGLQVLRELQPLPVEADGTHDLHRVVEVRPRLLASHELVQDDAEAEGAERIVGRDSPSSRKRKLRQALT